MPKVKFFLNSSGVRDLLRSSEMSSIVQSAAQQVAAEAEGLSGGLPFDVDGGAGRNRVYATVKPGSIHAFHKTRKENILEKAKRSVKV